MSNVVYVNEENFSSVVLESSQPVLLDFWADWCNPCKAMLPILDEIADDFAGRIIVAKMNIDENKQTPSKFNIRTIPTFILFKDGKDIKSIIGSQTKTQLANLLNKYC